MIFYTFLKKNIYLLTFDNQVAVNVCVSCSRQMSVIQRMKLVVRERGGYFALYRGIMPGTIRSFLANGTSMVVMATAQRKVTEWGLRGQ
jgi:hypothetical protein